MFKKTFAVAAVLIAVVIALMLPTGDALSTKVTSSGVRVTPTANFGSVLRFSYTWAAATDTAIFTWQPSRNKAPKYPYVLLFHVADTTSYNVRYKVSVDGTNYASSTLGTDSTTWASLAAAASPTVVVKPIDSLAVYPNLGYFPYTQLWVQGRAANKAGSSMKVWILEQSTQP